MSASSRQLTGGFQAYMVEQLPFAKLQRYKDRTQMAYDDGEHVKEVFAYFGLAYYEAGVLEAGLAIALMQISFLSHVRDQYLADGGKSFDRTQYEAEFDRFMESQHAQTLGNLIKRVSAMPELSDYIKERLRDAKRRRDFLSHHYFRERAVEFSNRTGRDKMIAELHNDGDIFLEIERDLYVELAPIREKLGMDGEKFQKYLAQFYAAHGVEYLTD
ncbi:hypothetical protein [Iodidimonas sp. SYSU 1G8]|uniref:hypothetical protein n=1 Tax=Iodidimonas sp. SYSU 1G8 TaxID=3133967 RepID=UPI0031FE54CD